MPIALEGVSFAYDDAHPALVDVDLQIADGEFLGIVGHTGSGKSTLVQLLNALLVPTSGRVLVDGMDTARKAHRREVRTRVGLVFQYPEQQLFASTVADDLAFGSRNLGLPSDEVVARCRTAMRHMGLDYDEFAERSPFDLSGGQKRRVAIAGVLAMAPRVLVLDEPAAGMDPATNAEIRGHLRELHAQGMTVVVVSHSMEQVAQLATHVVVLDAGRVVLQGPPARVFSPANGRRLEQLGLGLPAATRVAGRLAARGFGPDADVLTPDDLVQAVVSMVEKTGE